MDAQPAADDGKPNAPDPARLKKELQRIEEAIEAKESHRMGYVESCKPFNERISNAYEIAAKASDVSVKVLKAKVRERMLLRAAHKIQAQMDDGDRDTFAMVSAALGPFADMPLFGAALNAAEKAEDKRQGAVGETTWSDEDVAELRAMAADGKCAQDIADTLGKTRNQVSSKAGRLDLKLAPGGRKRVLINDAGPVGETALQRSADDIATENAERLRAGIKGLPGAEGTGNARLQ